MHIWKLQDAKNHFSELVNRSLTEGPQIVTRRGEEAVVILAAPEYRRLVERPSLFEVLRTAPRGEPLDMERTLEPIRDLDW